MVQATAVAGKNVDPRRCQLERGVERELQVGRVLRLRMANDLHTCRRGGFERVRRHGVEVPDGRRRREPECTRVLETAVRGDHGRAGRHAERGLSRGGAPPATTTTASSVMRCLRWYYPDQVRGSAAPPSALSARLPRAPQTLRGS